METVVENLEKISPVTISQLEQDEENGRLSSAAIAGLQKAGMYKMYLPTSLGGLETDPMTVAKVIERVARHNPAAAWSLMVANASHWWSKFLPAEAIEEMYHSSSDVFNAGTFAAAMMATPVKGGYSVTGQVPLCSNVHEAKWVCALTVVMQNGKPVINDGHPEMRAMFMKVEECSIIDTWHALGMKATDSNDISATNVFVPQSRTFVVSPQTENNRYYQGPLYRFPVAGINGGSLIVPVALGIATRALEELKKLTEKVPSGSAVTLKEKGSFQRTLGKTEALVGSARAYLIGALTDCWNKVEAGESTSPYEKATLLLAASHANQSCVEAVDMIYAAAGTTAVYTRSRISRCFTDIQVVRQHGFANGNRFETAAQMLLGLQPDFLPAML